MYVLIITHDSTDPSAYGAFASYKEAEHYLKNVVYKKISSRDWHRNEMGWHIEKLTKSRNL